MISWMRISSQRSQRPERTSGSTSFAKPGSMPEVKKELWPLRHASSSCAVTGSGSARVDEAHDRARHHILAGREDAAHVLHRLEGAAVGRGGVADAVGVGGEEGVGVVRGLDAGGRQAAELG